MFFTKIKTEKNFCQILLEMVEGDLNTLLPGKNAVQNNRYISFILKIGLGNLDYGVFSTAECMGMGIDTQNKEIKDELEQLIEFVKQNLQSITLIQVEIEELGIIVRRRFQKINESEFECRLYKLKLIYNKNDKEKKLDKAKWEMKEKPQDKTFILEPKKIKE